MKIKNKFNDYIKLKRLFGNYTVASNKMPYKKHTEEYVREVLLMWDELIDATYTTISGEVKKLFTQKEVVEIIEVESGVKVSVRTVKNWKKGNGLKRGQGIGQERGGYFNRNQQETIKNEEEEEDE